MEEVRIRKATVGDAEPILSLVNELALKQIMLPRPNGCFLDEIGWAIFSPQLIKVWRRLEHRRFAFTGHQSSPVRCAQVAQLLPHSTAGPPAASSAPTPRCRTFRPCQQVASTWLRA